MKNRAQAAQKYRDEHRQKHVRPAQYQPAQTGQHDIAKTENVIINFIAAPLLDKMPKKSAALINKIKHSESETTAGQRARQRRPRIGKTRRLKQSQPSGRRHADPHNQSVFQINNGDEYENRHVHQPNQHLSAGRVRVSAHDDESGGHQRGRRRFGEGITPAQFSRARMRLTPAE